MPRIKKVTYSKPVTLIRWDDDTITKAFCDEVDNYDELTGFLMCVIKKMVPAKEMRKLFSKYVYGDDPKYIKRIMPKKEREAQKVRFIGANQPIEFTMDAFIDPKLTSEYFVEKSAEDFVNALDDLLAIFNEG